MTTYAINAPDIQEQHAVILSKGNDGWRAVTRIPLGPTQVLKISTYKPMSPGKGLRSQATVSKVDACRETFVMGFGVSGDFSKVIAHTLPARVTASVIRAQHDGILTTPGILRALKSEIEHHYEAQRIAKAAEKEGSHV